MYTVRLKVAYVKAAFVYILAIRLLKSLTNINLVYLTEYCCIVNYYIIISSSYPLLLVDRRYYLRFHPSTPLYREWHAVTINRHNLALPDVLWFGKEPSSSKNEESQ